MFNDIRYPTESSTRTWQRSYSPHEYLNILHKSTKKIIIEPFNVIEVSSQIALFENESKAILALGASIAHNISNDEFLPYFDVNPVRRTFRGGWLGTIFGHAVVTDGYLAKRLKFLPPNEAEFYLF